MPVVGVWRDTSHDGSIHSALRGVRDDDEATFRATSVPSQRDPPENERWRSGGRQRQRTRARASFAMEALNKIRDAVDNTIREQARKQARRQVAGASLADPVSSIPRRPAFLFPSADPS